jgi:hypothetical protein
MSLFHHKHPALPSTRLLLAAAIATTLAGLAGCGGEDAGQASQTEEKRDLVAESKAREAEAKALREREAEELDRLIAAMQPVYDELASVQKSATKLHDRLIRRLKRQSMPAEHADEITKFMTDANYLLKNPKQLGAFKSVAGVQEELQRMQQTTAQLERVDTWVPEQR